MSLYGPLETSVEMIERWPNFVDLMIRNRNGVRSYQLYSHKTLDAAYGNPSSGTFTSDSKVGGAGAVAFLTVDKGRAFRSRTLRRKRLGVVDESRRGMSRILYDPVDFVSASFPPDEEFVFIRVQEWDQVAGAYRVVLGTTNTGDPVLGPIYILPRSGFFSTATPSVTLAGTAPANTGAVVGSPPPIHVGGQDPDPLHIVLPRAADELRLRNTHATQAMLIAFGLGQPMAEIPPDTEFPIFDGSVKSIIVASTNNDGGTAVAPTFSGYVSILSGGAR